MKKGSKIERNYIKIKNVYSDRYAKEVLGIAKHLSKDMRALPPRFDTEGIKIELYSYGNRMTNEFEVIQEALDIFIIYLEQIVKGKRQTKKKKMRDQ